MADSFIKFDAVNLHLKKGMHLVEAGAGTGKTYAITMLVLRGVVELAVPIDKILIVTFTKAATEELRGRIRARLAEARDLLKESVGGAAGQGDPTILSWLATLQDKEEALVRLQAALYDIDCGAIFTIHGYCQRMLMEQALESSHLFDTELLADIELIQKQVVEDHWRKHIYPMDPLPCAILTERFSTPEALLSSISLALNSGRFDLIVPQTATMEVEIASLSTSMERVHSWWLENKKIVYDQFEKAIEEKCVNKRVYTNFDAWFRELDAFLSRSCLLLPDELELLSKQKLLTELSGAKFRTAEKKEQYVQEWVFPGTELDDLLLAINNLILSFRVGLASELSSAVSKQLLLQGAMGFDDLIRNLALRLRGSQQGTLKSELAKRYTVALIDEFQDTDRDQYHIFKTLFGGGNHYLYLIGDPKQAIYKFRGADIYSYFQAKKSADTLLTLDRNYRSHPHLIQEVNRLFSSRHKPFTYDEMVLGYDPVETAKSDEDLSIRQEDRNLAGMVYCTLPPLQSARDGRWSGGKAREQCSHFVVAEITRLLNRNSPAILLGKDRDERFERPLAPKDIAILVRKNSEAEEYRDSLIKYGIPSVVTSRSSVFHTSECGELLLLLYGITNPVNIGRIKAAMTISWFGFTGDELRELWKDDVQFSIFQSKFADYLTTWRDQNFLTMMNRLLEQEEVLVNLVAHPYAERKIANISQLIELIQEQAQNENLGVSQTLYWLLQMNQDEKPGEGGELLLESDEEAVQIVTMHGAKGLEYPVVFCPVLWSATDFFGRERNQVVAHEEENNLVVLDLGSEDFSRRKEQARKEQAAEDIRLLYVALTRAKLRCYTLWADAKKHGTSLESFNSALGYLLFPDGTCSSELQQDILGTLADTSPVEFMVVGTESSPVTYMNESQQNDLAPQGKSDRRLQSDWQLTSFSAMAMFSEQPQTHKSVDSAPGERHQRVAIEFTEFPAGPKFGNVVHDLLEEFSFGNVTPSDEFFLACEKKLQRYGVDGDPERLVQLLRTVVATPLPAGFALGDLEDSRCLKEMEFYFQLSPVATGEINTILAEEKTVLPLNLRSMRGYLTGFVDLVCEFSGKYYVVDYKTNYLGDMKDNYQPAELENAMQTHNYGLQYWLYTLVLHRHLQNVLPSYDYEKDFGGVMYLFIRGMSPEGGDSGIYFVQPKLKTLELLDRAMGESRND